MHVKGFTMIELLIVVSLSALLTAVVAPNLWGQFIRYTERNHIEGYLADIKKAILKNRKSGHFFIFSSEQEQTKVISEKHKIEIISGNPVIFRPDRVCSGGEILLKTESNNTWRLSFTNLDCQLTLSYEKSK
ncbi:MULTISPECIES: Tfp pilus assembly protein FimT/FimU [Aeromonas]|uniref:pilus assembly FimT family protein n=1 Tax=Aeromonas TaxID=642 RepID=UPI0009D6B75F|nr:MULTISPECIES: prepilin-type N-terminal cleavage/methylation domain-containing protein [Aeromonas]